MDGDPTHTHEPNLTNREKQHILLGKLGALVAPIFLCALTDEGGCRILPFNRCSQLLWDIHIPTCITELTLQDEALEG